MTDTRKIFLTGLLGQDPEANMTTNGKTVMNISLASKEFIKDGNDKTHWFNLEIWENNAKFVRDYFPKGSPVYVEGESCVQKYTKDGIEKIRHYVKVKKIRALYKKPKED